MSSLTHSFSLIHSELSQMSFFLLTVSYFVLRIHLEVVKKISFKTPLENMLLTFFNQVRERIFKCLFKKEMHYWRLVWKLHKSCLFKGHFHLVFPMAIRIQSTLHLRNNYKGRQSALKFSMLGTGPSETQFLHYINSWKLFHMIWISCNRFL